MGYQDDRLEFHRRHPRLGKTTIEVYGTAEIVHIRRVARELGLIHHSGGLFQVKNGRDGESVTQGIERELDHFAAMRDAVTLGLVEQCEMQDADGVRCLYPVEDGAPLCAWCAAELKARYGYVR